MIHSILFPSHLRNDGLCGYDWILRHSILPILPIYFSWSSVGVSSEVSGNAFEAASGVGNAACASVSVASISAGMSGYQPLQFYLELLYYLKIKDSKFYFTSVFYHPYDIAIHINHMRTLR